MDSSKSQLNDLVLSQCNKDTPKLFFNKYLYKVTLSTDGYHIYGNKLRQCIEKLRKNYSEHKVDVRIENSFSKISVFSNSEKDLYDVVTSLNLKLFGFYIVSIYRPTNKEAQEKLLKGTWFIKNPKFKYRVVINERRHTFEVKKQILSYIDNHKDKLSISRGIRYLLNFDGRSYIRGYFYVNDLEYLLFLKMISPDFVGRVYTLEDKNDIT